MRPVYWKLIVTSLVGVCAGLFGGQATIAGMTPSAPLSTIGGGGGDTGWRGELPAPQATGASEGSLVTEDCDGCSDFDLGYRFAAARDVRESAECMEFTWSYQRGCLARLRENQG